MSTCWYAPIALARYQAGKGAVADIHACEPLPTVLQPGPPPTRHQLASRVEARTGRRLLLRAPDDALSSGPYDVEVYLDGELLGQFEFWWDDAEPDHALADLEYALPPYLDEELRREDS